MNRLINRNGLRRMHRADQPIASALFAEWRLCAPPRKPLPAMRPSEWVRKRDCSATGCGATLVPMIDNRPARYCSRQARRCTFPLEVFGRLPALMKTMVDTEVVLLGQGCTYAADKSSVEQATPGAPLPGPAPRSLRRPLNGKRCRASAEARHGMDSTVRSDPGDNGCGLERSADL